MKNNFKREYICSTLQEWAADYWVKGGMPRSKLVIGIPSYGRGFILANATYHDIGDDTVNASLPGEYTRAAGILAYYEVRLPYL